MFHRTTILYILIWIAYVVFAFAKFPIYLYNVSIPVMPLIALGSWLYGRKAGLWLVLAGTIYFFFICQYFADIYVHYYERLLAPVLCYYIAGLFGTLRHKLDSIKTANLELDELVAERNNDLEALAAKLIDDTEKIRISQGQLLHDGIGQHLTGIQLYCSSLVDQLLEEKNSSVSVAYSLRKKGNITHNQIRQLARMMFPVKIGEVGLIPALQELASCFVDFEHVEFNILEFGKQPELPENIALQLYRICQEHTNHAIYQLSASRVEVQIFTTKLNFILKFGHNGSAQPEENENQVLQLIDYRLQEISGHAQSGYSVNHLKNTIYTIPYPEIEVVV